jgi:guanosine-3',5'-bis(diphosphate) 3'-pyrophosphohydrolase
MSPLDPAFHRLLDAIAFAARAHHGQFRKDRVTPYHSHVFRVCLIARHVFGVEDAAVLTAAVLHDTIEDTTTDFDDVEERFGPEIAGWVALLSKDKRMQDEKREHAYCDGLRNAPWQVKLCKLADIYDNLTDSAYLKPEQRPRAYQRARVYLDALAAPNLPPPVQRAHTLVSAMLERILSGAAAE